MNYKIISNKIGKEGEYRKFSFSKKDFQIKEVLEIPEISMYWKWDSGICPHCKRRIVREIKHIFYRIEILADKNKEENEITLDDIELIGDTLDNRKMRIPKDNNAFKEALLKSEKFGRLVKQNGD